MAFSNKRQTKHIKTKKIEQLEKLDKAAWVLPGLVFLWIFRGSFLQLFSEGFVVGLFTAGMMFLLMGIFYVPLMMIWRAVSRTLKQSAIAQTTFPVLEDFDYYRDELTGISPATISMCVDFEIERDKDLAAQLLKFTMQGLIETDGGQITVCEGAIPPALTSSEHFLLDALRHGTLSVETANEWAKLAYDEVMAGPYLTKKEVKKPKAGGPAGCLGCLPFFLVVGASVPLLESKWVQPIMNAPDNLTQAQTMAYLTGTPDALIGCLIIAALGIGLFCGMALPFSVVIRGILLGKTQAKDRYKRTNAGEILTEEIYGLKNFIHDFSDLEAAQKEALVLWDDFLIYAVLLEENTSIVKEITALRDVKTVPVSFQ